MRRGSSSNADSTPTTLSLERRLHVARAPSCLSDPVWCPPRLRSSASVGVINVAVVCEWLCDLFCGDGGSVGRCTRCRHALVRELSYELTSSPNNVFLSMAFSSGTYNMTSPAAAAACMMYMEYMPPSSELLLRRQLSVQGLEAQRFSRRCKRWGWA